MALSAFIAALLLQISAQLLLLFLLEPGFDLTMSGYRAVKIVSAGYASLSLIGGLTCGITIPLAMALFAVGLTAVLAIALWHSPAPVRSLIERLR
ncbi:MAG: hypothetical protein O9281_05390 [Novosphingobium sp.]|uniref:hypothetical protein n=1 Tax=Novosphingobium sp. TaxID=1874826 RepID=UPI0022C05699|nr:hypothetical protein [Novosphingobium sp.]MCZ8051354.1 hypothetical protein [Novosphingobium sp.]MCZ8245530.1 hypothetical protein [Novosphingobium sp.]MCZ8264046.1 hypothetical protein [Novosphingobium sp.]